MSNPLSTPPAPPPPCPYFCANRRIINGGVFFIAPVAFMFTLLLLLLIIQMRRLGSRQRQLSQTRSQLNLLIQNAIARSEPGLPKEVINSFPVETFGTWKTKDQKSNDENLQCPVCLGDYEDSEKLRMLPCHVFHVECIDAWLETHTTCPTCRKSFITSSTDSNGENNANNSNNTESMQSSAPNTNVNTNEVTILVLSDADLPMHNERNGVHMEAIAQTLTNASGNSDGRYAVSLSRS